jgi:hypothetical protein
VNNSPYKTLALTPHKHFSLWDMIQLRTKEFIPIWDEMEKAIGHTFLNRERAALANEQEALINLMVGLSNRCNEMRLRESAYLCKESLSWLIDPAYHALTVPGEPGKYKFPKSIPPRPLNSINTELQTIRKKIYEEMDSIRLAVIPQDKAGFFEQNDLLGKSFHDSASPEISAEIKAAGNCLAADLNTAAIFHLMRAVEHAMRAVVVHLKIRVKNKPLEHAGWDEMIKLIEKKIRDKREKYEHSRKRNRKDLEACKFFRIVADELNFFKEIWRDNTMHSQRLYHASEAIRVFERVRDFMQRLVKRIPLQ